MTPEQELKLAAIDAANKAVSTASFRTGSGGYGVGSAIEPGRVLEEAKRIYAWLSEKAPEALRAPCQDRMALFARLTELAKAHQHGSREWERVVALIDLLDLTERRDHFEHALGPKTYAAKIAALTTAATAP